MATPEPTELTLLERAYPWVRAYATGTKLHEDLYWRLVNSGRLLRDLVQEDRFSRARVIESGAPI